MSEVDMASGFPDNSGRTEVLSGEEETFHGDAEALHGEAETRGDEAETHGDEEAASLGSQCARKDMADQEDTAAGQKSSI